MDETPYIPGYEFLECLGGGPLTSVFAARRQDDDRLCAVKTLRPPFGDDSTAVKLIQREARAGLMVQHPNLVEVIDAHVTRPPYFLVMELLEGVSLRQIMGATPRMEWPQAVAVLHDVGQALLAMHLAGFLHGDVKPENILVSGEVVDGESPAVDRPLSFGPRPLPVKLIDLGFAHRPGENRPFLADGYILGTVNYLAPEMLDPDASPDWRSDLYSLGVMLHEMLTGELPFRPGSVRETLRNHRFERPADPQRLAPELPERIIQLINRLITPAADRRIPHVMSLLQQLAPLNVGCGHRLVA